MNQDMEFKDDGILINGDIFELFLNGDNPTDAGFLYVFYMYISNSQNTRSIKATTGHTANNLQWSEGKVRKYKKVLVKLGMVGDQVVRDGNGRVSSHRIKINNHPKMQR